MFYLSFPKKTFNIRDISENLNVDWQEISLQIIDKDVLINYFSEENSEFIYLKTLNPLPKCEFDIIFGFNAGEFKKNKIIRVRKKDICIY